MQSKLYQYSWKFSMQLFWGLYTEWRWLQLWWYNHLLSNLSHWIIIVSVQILMNATSTYQCANPILTVTTPSGVTYVFVMMAFMRVLSTVVPVSWLKYIVIVVHNYCLKNFTASLHTNYSQWHTQLVFCNVNADFSRSLQMSESCCWFLRISNSVEDIPDINIS